MEQQTNKHEEAPKRVNIQSFNFALFLGFCVLSISIFAAGNNIAARMTNSMHGHFSGTLMSGNNFANEREFLTEWEAAHFIGMNQAEFITIVESGELAGAYTVFQLERTVWNHPAMPEGFYATGELEQQTPPVQIEVYTAPFEHRVFSRERLSDWLLSRIDNQ